MEGKIRIALLGECMIELRGQLFGAMQQYFGGDTLNTAVYLARLAADGGIEVAYATELGTDAFSDAMLRAVEEEMQAVMPSAFIARERQTVEVGEAMERACSTPHLALIKTA